MKTLGEYRETEATRRTEAKGLEEDKIWLWVYVGDEKQIFKEIYFN